MANSKKTDNKTRLNKQCLVTLALMIGAAPIAWADSITLRYQVPSAKTYHEYYSNQSFLKKFINDRFEVDTAPQVQVDLLIAAEVIPENNGHRVRTQFIPRDKDSVDTMLASQPTVSPRQLELQFFQAVNLLPTLDLPDYFVNSDGRLTSVADVDDNYRKNMPLAVQSLLRQSNNNANNNQKTLAKLKRQTAKIEKQLLEYDFLPNTISQSFNVEAFDGITLEQGGAPVKGVVLLGDAKKSSIRSTGTLEYLNRTRCHEAATVESCVLLKHVAVDDKSDAAKKTISKYTLVSNLIVDPDSLQVYSMKMTSKTETKTRTQKKSQIQEVVTQRQYFYNGLPTEAALNAIKANHADLLAFERAPANWDDFAEIYQSQIKSINHARSVCRRGPPKPSSVKKSTSAKKLEKFEQVCSSVKSFYHDLPTLAVFDHFENTVKPETRDTQLKKNLHKAIGTLFEKRIPELLMLELHEKRKVDSSLTQSQSLAAAPDIVRRLVDESPIDNARHIRYINKLPAYFESLQHVKSKADKPSEPKR